MKRILAACLLPATLLATPAISPAADEGAISGKWQIHISIAGRENDLSCNFVPMAADLTGTCTSPQGSADLTGKVEDKKATWTYKINTPEGGPVTLTYKGTVKDDGTMSGSISVQEYGVEGEFKATKDK